MAEPCPFLSVEDENNKLLCNRGLLKKGKSQILSIKGWENFKEISKTWMNVNIPIDDQYHNLTLVYEEVKNAEKPFGRVHTKCRTLFSTKRDIYADRYSLLTHLVTNSNFLLEFIC